MMSLSAKLLRFWVDGHPLTLSSHQNTNCSSLRAVKRSRETTTLYLKVLNIKILELAQKYTQKYNAGRRP